MSHFLEHMLFKGTERRTTRDILALVQSHGGTMNAYTTFDRTVYHIDLPSESVEVALDVLGDAVFHSRLPEEEVVRERDVILREIDMYQDDPDSLLSQALFETAFHDHPYRQPIIGHRAVFEKVSRDDLVDYYRSRYVPNNVVAIVVGDVDEEATFASLEKHFGTCPRARLEPVYLPEEPGQLAPRSRELTGDVQITRVGLAYQVPGLEHPDTPALDLLAMVLGHGDSSFFWQELRERNRLVHSVGAANWNPGSSGLFYVSLVCEPENQEAAIAGVNEVIGKLLTRGIPESVLAKAIRQIQVGEINVRKTMSGQASRLGVAEVVVGEVNFAPTYLRRLGQITVADLKRVAGAYLKVGRLTRVTMNPKGRAKTEAPSVGRRSANPDFEEVRLSNGMRVLFRENPSLPNLNIRVVGRAGGFLEPDQSRGITQLMATLLTRDTEKRSAAKVAGLIESVGGSFSEFAGDNSFGLSCEVLPEDSALALDVLSDAFLRPAFKPATVRREREAQLAGIREARDDIVHAARFRFRELFFGQHPLAVDSEGTLEMVGRLRPKDLRFHRDQLVRAGNLVVAASGAFDREELLGRIEEAFSSLPEGEVELSENSPGLPVTTGHHVLSQDREQVIVFHGFPGPGVLSEDFMASEVLDAVLSGGASRLFERVRGEQGLAYFVHSGRILAMTEGMFFFVAGTNPGGYRQVISEFCAEVDRACDGGFSEEELQGSVARLKAGRRMSMQTNSACSIQAALNAIYGLPVNDWRNYDAKIDAVTLEDLQRFAQTRFSSENRLELLAGAVGEGKLEVRSKK